MGACPLKQHERNFLMSIAIRLAWLPAVLAMCALMATGSQTGAQGEPSLTTLQALQDERRSMVSAFAPSIVAVARSRPNLANMGQTGMAGGRASAATGFVVDGDYVLTCMEAGPLIVGGADPFMTPGPSSKVWMMAHDGTEFEGVVIGRDVRNLLLLIRMQDGHPKLPSLTLGDSDALPMGSSCVSLGNSLDSMLIDRVVSMSYGSVSGSYRFEPIDVMTPGAEGTHGDPYKGNVLEVDVAVHDGDYGGPVLNLDGQVIGMLNSHFMAGRHLGSAVPSNQIRAVLPQLKKGIKEDELAKAELGFAAGTRADKHGIFINRVTPGGPADKAGIKADMQLVRIDNYRIPGFDYLREMLGVGRLTQKVGGSMFEPGREVTISYGLPVGTHIQLTLLDPATGRERTVDLVVGEKQEDF